MAAPGRPHPSLVNARETIAAEQAVHDRHLLELERAIMLAPNLTVCEALLRGEAVPLSKLDAVYVRRYGIRRAS